MLDGRDETDLPRPLRPRWQRGARSHHHMCERVCVRVRVFWYAAGWLSASSAPTHGPTLVSECEAFGVPRWAIIGWEFSMRNGATGEFVCRTCVSIYVN